MSEDSAPWGDDLPRPSGVEDEREIPPDHFPAFKAKVALAAFNDELTLAELTKPFDLHANQVAQLEGGSRSKELRAYSAV